MSGSLNIPLEEFYKTEWFQTRPEFIKQAFYDKPIDKTWYLIYDKERDAFAGSCFIIGIDEGKNKLTYIINVEGLIPPITNRQVFGIKKSDLKTREEIEALGIRILY